MGSLHRKLLWGFARGLVVGCISVTVSGCVLGCADQPSIWVNGVDGMNSGGFSYNVANYRILQTGFVDSFRVGLSKDDFFDGLRGTYRVFEESQDRVSLIWHDQVYTVRYYRDGRYELYGEMFWVKDSHGAILKFPFPTDKIDTVAGTELASPQPSVVTEFTVSCDLPYLLRFYEVYGDRVRVEGNRIHHGGVSVIVEGGGLVEVDVP
jgi:hypothetical protein